MTIPNNDKRRCYNCKFYYRQDEGYSNYTVEATKAHCLKKRNGNLPTDEGYGWETDDHEFMKVAELCSDFSAGEPLYIDCDHENIPYDRDPAKNDAAHYSQDPQVIAAWDEWAKAP